MKWVQGGEYDRIVRGEYRTRDQEADVREEAGDAVEFYAERFRTIFREVGDNLTKAGSQIGGMAEQLADWLRQRNPGDAERSRRRAVRPQAPARGPPPPRRRARGPLRRGSLTRSLDIR